MDRVSDYLRAAREAGALHDTGTGFFVAGGYFDRARGVTQYLVTYCDEATVRDGSLVRTLPSAAHVDVPEADTVVVRLASELLLEAPWHRFVSYVRHPGKPVELSEVDGVTVEAADLVRDRELILGWLADAIAEAVTSQDDKVPPGAPESIAVEVLATEGSQTYVARHRGRSIGHATLLCRSTDDVTGADFIELFDILVTPGHSLHRTAVRMLTEASLDHAHRSGLPLIGNVIHPPAGAGRERSERVMNSLIKTGWETDYVLWRGALEELGNG